MKLELQRIIQIIFVLAVLVTAFVYRTYQPHADPAEMKAQGQATEFIDLCDFAKGCEAILSQLNGAVLVSAAPGSRVLAETPLPLSLTLPEGVQLDKAILVGKEMFMGTIPVIFSATTNPQIMAGELLLGACITESMIWQMRVEVSQDNRKETVMFDFEMRNH